MLIIGHRGSAGTHPENTLPSIQAGLDSGADWIEIDIRQVDGELIVLHDDTLDRTTDGRGSVYDYNLAQLAEFDAGNGARIPLLRDVLALIDGRCGLNIELKQTGLNDKLLQELATTMDAQPSWRDRILISSFLLPSMRELARAKPPHCKLAWLSKNANTTALDEAINCGAFSFNISLTNLSREFVQETHQRRLRLLVYTVNETDDLRRCHEFGVDGVFTDFPARALELFRTHNSGGENQ